MPTPTSPSESESQALVAVSVPQTIETVAERPSAVKDDTVSRISSTVEIEEISTVPTTTSDEEEQVVTIEQSTPEAMLRSRDTGKSMKSVEETTVVIPPTETVQERTLDNGDKVFTRVQRTVVVNQRKEVVQSCQLQEAGTYRPEDDDLVTSEPIHIQVQGTEIRAVTPELVEHIEGFQVPRAVPPENVELIHMPTQQTEGGVVEDEDGLTVRVRQVTRHVTRRIIRKRRRIIRKVVIIDGVEKVTEEVIEEPDEVDEQTSEISSGPVFDYVGTSPKQGRPEERSRSPYLVISEVDGGDRGPSPSGAIGDSTGREGEGSKREGAAGEGATGSLGVPSTTKALKKLKGNEDEVSTSIGTAELVMGTPPEDVDALLKVVKIEEVKKRKREKRSKKKERQSEPATSMGDIGLPPRSQPIEIVRGGPSPYSMQSMESPIDSSREQTPGLSSSYTSSEGMSPDEVSSKLEITVISASDYKKDLDETRRAASRMEDISEDTIADISWVDDSLSIPSAMIPEDEPGAGVVTSTTTFAEESGQFEKVAEEPKVIKQETREVERVQVKEDFSTGATEIESISESVKPLVVEEIKPISSGESEKAEKVPTQPLQSVVNVDIVESERRDSSGPEGEIFTVVLPTSVVIPSTEEAEVVEKAGPKSPEITSVEGKLTDYSSKEVKPEPELPELVTVAVEAVVPSGGKRGSVEEVTIEKGIVMEEKPLETIPADKTEEHLEKTEEPVQTVVNVAAEKEVVIRTLADPALVQITTEMDSELSKSKIGELYIKSEIVMEQVKESTDNQQEAMGDTHGADVVVSISRQSEAVVPEQEANVMLEKSETVITEKSTGVLASEEKLVESPEQSVSIMEKTAVVAPEKDKERKDRSKSPIPVVAVIPATPDNESPAHQPDTVFAEENATAGVSMDQVISGIEQKILETKEEFISIVYPERKVDETTEENAAENLPTETNASDLRVSDNREVVPENEKMDEDESQSVVKTAEKLIDDITSLVPEILEKQHVDKSDGAEGNRDLTLESSVELEKAIINEDEGKDNKKSEDQESMTPSTVKQPLGEAVDESNTADSQQQGVQPPVSIQDKRKDVEPLIMTEEQQSKDVKSDADKVEILSLESIPITSEKMESASEDISEPETLTSQIAEIVPNEPGKEPGEVNQEHEVVLETKVKAEITPSLPRVSLTETMESTEVILMPETSEIVSVDTKIKKAEAVPVDIPGEADSDIQAKLESEASPANDEKKVSKKSKKKAKKTPSEEKELSPDTPSKHEEVVKIETPVTPTDLQTESLQTTETSCAEKQVSFDSTAQIAETTSQAEAELILPVSSQEEQVVAGYEKPEVKVVERITDIDTSKISTDSNATGIEPEATTEKQEDDKKSKKSKKKKDRKTPTPEKEIIESVPEFVGISQEIQPSVDRSKDLQVSPDTMEASAYNPEEDTNEALLSPAVEMTEATTSLISSVAIGQKSDKISEKPIEHDQENLPTKPTKPAAPTGDAKMVAEVTPDKVPICEVPETVVLVPESMGIAITAQSESDAVTAAISLSDVVTSSETSEILVQPVEKDDQLTLKDAESPKKEEIVSKGESIIPVDSLAQTESALEPVKMETEAIPSEQLEKITEVKDPSVISITRATISFEESEREHESLIEEIELARSEPDSLEPVSQKSETDAQTVPTKKDDDLEGISTKQFEMSTESTTEDSKSIIVQESSTVPPTSSATEPEPVKEIVKNEADKEAEPSIKDESEQATEKEEPGLAEIPIVEENIGESEPHDSVSAQVESSPLDVLVSVDTPFTCQTKEVEKTSTKSAEITTITDLHHIPDEVGQPEKQAETSDLMKADELSPVTKQKDSEDKPDEISLVKEETHVDEFVQPQEMPVDAKELVKQTEAVSREMGVHETPEQKSTTPTEISVQAAEIPSAVSIISDSVLVEKQSKSLPSQPEGGNKKHFPDNLADRSKSPIPTVAIVPATPDSEVTVTEAELFEEKVSEDTSAPTFTSSIKDEISSEEKPSTGMGIVNEPSSEVSVNIAQKENVTNLVEKPLIQDETEALEKQEESDSNKGLCVQEKEPEKSSQEQGMVKETQVKYADVTPSMPTVSMTGTVEGTQVMLTPETTEIVSVETNVKEAEAVRVDIPTEVPTGAASKDEDKKKREKSKKKEKLAPEILVKPDDVANKEDEQFPSTEKSTVLVSDTQEPDTTTKLTTQTATGKERSLVEKIEPVMPGSTKQQESTESTMEQVSEPIQPLPVPESDTGVSIAPEAIVTQGMQEVEAETSAGDKKSKKSKKKGKKTPSPEKELSTETMEVKKKQADLEVLPSSIKSTENISDDTNLEVPSDGTNVSEAVTAEPLVEAVAPVVIQETGSDESVNVPEQSEKKINEKKTEKKGKKKGKKVPSTEKELSPESMEKIEKVEDVKSVPASTIESTEIPKTDDDKYSEAPAKETKISDVVVADPTATETTGDAPVELLEKSEVKDVPSKKVDEEKLKKKGKKGKKTPPTDKELSPDSVENVEKEDVGEETSSSAMESTDIVSDDTIDSGVPSDETKISTEVIVTEPPVEAVDTAATQEKGSDTPVKISEKYEVRDVPVEEKKAERKGKKKGKKTPSTSTEKEPSPEMEKQDNVEDLPTSSLESTETPQTEDNKDLGVPTVETQIISDTNAEQAPMESVPSGVTKEISEELSVQIPEKSEGEGVLSKRVDEKKTEKKGKKKGKKAPSPEKELSSETMEKVEKLEDVEDVPAPAIESTEVPETDDDKNLGVPSEKAQIVPETTTVGESVVPYVTEQTSAEKSAEISKESEVRDATSEKVNEKERKGKKRGKKMPSTEKETSPESVEVAGDGQQRKVAPETSLVSTQKEQVADDDKGQEISDEVSKEKVPEDAAMESVTSEVCSKDKESKTPSVSEAILQVSEKLVSMALVEPKILDELTPKTKATEESSKELVTKEELVSTVITRLEVAEREHESLIEEIELATPESATKDTSEEASLEAQSHPTTPEVIQEKLPPQISVVRAKISYEESEREQESLIEELELAQSESDSTEPISLGVDVDIQTMPEIKILTQDSATSPPLQELVVSQDSATSPPLQEVLEIVDIATSPPPKEITTQESSTSPVPEEVVPTTEISTSPIEQPVSKQESSSSPPPAVITSESATSPPPMVITKEIGTLPPAGIITSESATSPPPAVITSESGTSPPEAIITSESATSPPPAVITSESGTSPPEAIITLESATSPPPAVITSESGTSPPDGIITSDSATSPPPMETISTQDVGTSPSTSETDSKHVHVTAKPESAEISTSTEPLDTKNVHTEAIPESINISTSIQPSLEDTKDIHVQAAPETADASTHPSEVEVKEAQTSATPQTFTTATSPPPSVETREDSTSTTPRQLSTSADETSTQTEEVQPEEKEKLPIIPAVEMTDAQMTTDVVQVSEISTSPLPTESVEAATSPEPLLSLSGQMAEKKAEPAIAPLQTVYVQEVPSHASFTQESAEMSSEKLEAVQVVNVPVETEVTLVQQPLMKVAAPDEQAEPDEEDSGKKGKKKRKGKDKKKSDEDKLPAEKVDQSKKQDESRHIDDKENAASEKAKLELTEALEQVQKPKIPAVPEKSIKAEVEEVPEQLIQPAGQETETPQQLESEVSKKSKKSKKKGKQASPEKSPEKETKVPVKQTEVQEVSYEPPAEPEYYISEPGENIQEQEVTLSVQPIPEEIQMDTLATLQTQIERSLNQPKGSQALMLISQPEAEDSIGSLEERIQTLVQRQPQEYTYIITEWIDVVTVITEVLETVRYWTHRIDHSPQGADEKRPQYENLQRQVKSLNSILDSLEKVESDEGQPLQSPLKEKIREVLNTTRAQSALVQQFLADSQEALKESPPDSAETKWDSESLSRQESSQSSSDQAPETPPVQATISSPLKKESGKRKKASTKRKSDKEASPPDVGEKATATPTSTGFNIKIGSEGESVIEPQQQQALPLEPVRVSVEPPTPESQIQYVVKISSPTTAPVEMVDSFMQRRASSPPEPALQRRDSRQDEGISITLGPTESVLLTSDDNLDDGASGDDSNITVVPVTHPAPVESVPEPPEGKTHKIKKEKKKVTFEKKQMEEPKPVPVIEIPGPSKQELELLDKVVDFKKELQKLLSAKPSRLMSDKGVDNVSEELQKITEKCKGLQQKAAQKEGVSSTEEIIFTEEILEIIEKLTILIQTVRRKSGDVKEDISRPVSEKVEVHGDLQAKLRSVDDAMDEVKNYLDKFKMNPEVKDHLYDILSGAGSVSHQAQENLRANADILRKSQDEYDNLQKLVEGDKRKINGFIDKILQITDNSKITPTDKLTQVDGLEPEFHKIKADIENNGEVAYKWIGDSGSDSSPLSQQISEVNVQLMNTETLLTEEKDRLVQIIGLAEEYEQTLQEFSQVIEVAEALVEEKLAVKNLSHLQDELQKNRSFFGNLKRCQQALEKLEYDLDASTREMHKELHQRLYNQATSILERAAKRRQQMAVASARWSRLEHGLNEEMNWLAQVSRKIPSLKGVASTDCERYCSTFQALYSDVIVHQARLMQLRTVCESLLATLSCQELEGRTDSLVEDLLNVSNRITSGLQCLIGFRDAFLNYERLLHRLKSWLQKAEAKMDAIALQPQSHPYDFWVSFCISWYFLPMNLSHELLCTLKIYLQELKAQLESQQPLKNESSTLLDSALRVLPVTDESVIRDNYANFEDRWLALSSVISQTEKASYIQSEADSPSVALAVRLNAMDKDVNEIKETLESMVISVETEDDLYCYLEKLQILKAQILNKKHQLNTIKKDTELEPKDAERIGALLAGLSGIDVQVTEELETAHVIREKFATFGRMALKARSQNFCSFFLKKH